MASVQTSSYDGRYLKLTVIEESYSISNNTSTIRWTLESIGGNSNYYSIYQWGVTINGQIIYATQNTEWSTYKFPAKKGSSTGTIVIQHNPDGTAPDVTFTLKGSVYYNRNNSYSGSISLTPLHTPPTVAIESITELNVSLIGVSNDTFVQYLSQKRFVLSATPYDDATITGYSVKNGNTIVNDTTATLDLNIQELYVDANVVPIIASASDSLNSVGSVQQNYSNYILYQKPTIEPTSTTTKRNGQTSGKCLLNVAGNYWVGQIGNIDNVPIVKYRYWEKGQNEPDTWITIPNESLILNDGRITVNNYEIGTNDPSQSNYFNYQKAYNIRVQIEDNYYADNTLKGITVGEAVWSEYKDRVDFIKAQVGGKDVLTVDDLPTETELYYDQTGTNTTVQLSDNTANYTYLEIYYYASNLNKSEKVYLPDGKKVSLDVNSYYTSGNDLYQYFYTKIIEINGSSITVEKNVELRILNNSVNNHTTDNKIYITRVVGIK